MDTFYAVTLLNYFFLNLGEEQSDENDGNNFEILLHFEVAIHCVKSVQIRSFFWSVFSRIRTADQKKHRIWTPFTQWL